MPKEHILVNDIITDHRERMLNLKKYYPFFKLSEISFSWFMDGKYDNLDMGYILMAVLRFFIEENNFKEQDVTYSRYYEFMTQCIRRDFGIILDEQDNKILVDYIFDKLRNDGKPFCFEYYDPVERVKKISRVKLFESRIQDGTVWYSISPEGIEFYLDTKEIKDESRISVEQLLLEKMIRSEDFKGGTEVVRRINQEVERLRLRKNKVIDLLTTDVFAGMEAYEHFFDTGIRWFDEEQKLFVKNKELIEAALKRGENEKLSGDDTRFYKTSGEIYRLDTELKVAMNNHSELLRACTDLGIKADEIIRRSKLSRLRSRFDFVNVRENAIKNNRVDFLQYITAPFWEPKINKLFDLSKIEDLLSYRPEQRETPEKVIDEPEQEIIFEDELAERRFTANCRTLFVILLELLEDKREISLEDYNKRVESILSTEVFKNGDYYAFLVHLCGKKDYILAKGEDFSETFLDGIIKEFLEEPVFAPYLGMHFELELAGGQPRELELGEYSSVTDFTVRRI
ncbi:MAG: hypothetical protein ACI4EN_06745 [Butyrivibrio sp.]